MPVETETSRTLRRLARQLSDPNTPIDRFPQLLAEIFSTMSTGIAADLATVSLLTQLPLPTDPALRTRTAARNRNLGRLVHRIGQQWQPIWTLLSLQPPR